MFSDPSSSEVDDHGALTYFKRGSPGERAASNQMLERWQADPVVFIRDVLGNKLWEKQRAIARAVWAHPRVAVKSCHGSGKTYLAAQLVIAFLFSFPYSRVVTTAPTYRQVVKLLWSEIARAHKRARVSLGGRLLTSELRIIEGWEATGYTSDDPDAFQGVHSESGHMLVIVDEASGVSSDILTAIEGILVGRRTRLLMIGNPTDPGCQFAREFHHPGTKRFTISSKDTPNIRLGRTVIPGLIDEAWVLDKQHRWGANSPIYQSRVLGEFPDISENQIYNLTWVDRAMARDDLEPAKTQPITLGLDVSRFGFDTTVLYAVQGSKAWRVKKTARQSTMSTVGMVIRCIRELKEQGHLISHIRVDDIGVGGGVSDRLLELNYPVKRINVGRPARDKQRFLNRRVEALYKLRDDLEHGHLQLEENDDLRSQMVAIKYKIHSEGKLKAQSKEEIKSLNLPSPDDLDALSLAYGDFDEVIEFEPTEDGDRSSLWSFPS